MKKLLLILIFSASTLLHAQSIEFTSAELTTAEIGSTITVDYKYTIAAEGNIYCAINLYNDWTWESKVVDGSLSPAVAGTDVTGSFTFTIPEGTTPTEDLTSPFNYKLVIELSDSGWNWQAGAYPATQINFTTNSLSVADSNLELDGVAVYPNPVADILKIKNQNNYPISNISITNILGKKVLEKKSYVSELQVSNLKKGVYIVAIKSNDRIKNIKFIKQ